MAVLFNIIVVNTATGCDTIVSDQVSVTGCSENYIVRISPGSNAIGPFDIYTGSTGTTAIYTSVSRDEMVYGKVITLSDPIGCITPTPTPTTSNTPTPTPTPTVTPSGVTPTPTPTPTTSPSFGIAYLFIEPQSGSTDIGQYMFDGGYSFYGFTNLSAPDTTSQVTFSNDMNGYVSYSGWTGGTLPTVRTQSVPQVSGGVDSFGNSIDIYNFTTHEVPLGTVGDNAWYTWIIPTGATNGGIQTVIDYNSLGNPNLMTPINVDDIIYGNTFTYSGATIPSGVYRVYTTFANLSFYLNNGVDTLYFKGNTVV